MLALIGKSFCECPPQVIQWRGGVVRVIAIGLTGNQHMQCVMHVVVPLRRGIHRFTAHITLEIARLVGVILQHEVYVALNSRPPMQRAGDLAHNIGRALVAYGMDGIEPQTVKAVFLDPEQGVVHEEIAHQPIALAVEIDCGTPGRAMRRIEKLWAICVKIVPVGTEVVVDHVEQHHQSQRMRCIDQRLQFIRTTIASCRGEWQHAVVTPVATAGESRHRHQLEGGDAKVHQIGQAPPRSGECTFRREAADM